MLLDLILTTPWIKSAKEVETALAGDIGFNSLAVESSLTGVEINYSGDGEKPTGVIKHTYSVYYRNLENAPDSAI